MSSQPLNPFPVVKSKGFSGGTQNRLPALDALGAISTPFNTMTLPSIPVFPRKFSFHLQRSFFCWSDFQSNVNRCLWLPYQMPQRNLEDRNYRSTLLFRQNILWDHRWNLVPHRGNRSVNIPSSSVGRNRLGLF